jgi:hypothetical protein
VTTLIITGSAKVNGISLTASDSIALAAPQTNYVWGAAVGADAAVASDSLPEFIRTNGLLGGALRYHRSYCPTTENAIPAEPAGVRPVRTCKPDLVATAAGACDYFLKPWILSAPVGAIISIQHEPENPKKFISAPVFDAGFNYFAKLVKQLRPDVRVGPIFMEYQMRTAAGYSYGKSIDPSFIDFWGVDTYSDYSEPVRTFAQCVTETALPYFNKLAPGKLIIVAETGIHSTAKHAGNGYSIGQAIDRPAWVRAMINWSAANNVLPLYYDVNTSSNLWKLSDPEWAHFLTL